MPRDPGSVRRRRRLVTFGALVLASVTAIRYAAAAAGSPENPDLWW